MTATETTEPPSDVLEESKEAHRRPVGFVLVAIVALVVGGIAGWLLRGSDSDATSTAPAGVEELLADYTGAWENSDVDAFRAVVTDDFVINEFLYQKVGAWFNLLTINDTVDETAIGVGRDLTSYQVDHVGEQIVVGDGPWYVSVQENWAGQVMNADGTATYVIVADQDGALKIAGHIWVGLERMDN